MNIFKSLLLTTFWLLLTHNAWGANYPADPSTARAWDGSSTWVDNFNAARLNDSSVTNTLSLPNDWGTRTDVSKAFWLINQERIDRGLLPFTEANSAVNSVAQNYADYLLANDTFDHSADGSSPQERLEANATIKACHDTWTAPTENLALRVTSGNSIAEAVESMLYNWLYDDSNSGWGHRHALLWSSYNNNDSDPNSEGLLGVGIARGGPYTLNGRDWNHAVLLVANFVDQCATWQGANVTQVNNVTINGNTSGNINTAYTFTAEVSPSDASTPLTYNWSSDGLVSGQGTTSAVYQWATDGTHSVTVTVSNDGGAASVNDSHSITLTSTTAHITNISTRAHTSTSLSSVIAGFVIQGTGACDVMIRGFGKGIGLSPSLDTQLLLQTFPQATQLAQNSSWQTGNPVASIPAHLHLPDPSDAGIYTRLSAGAYTVTMTPEGVTGIGLIGVDEVSCDAGTKLVNISTRAEDRTGAEAMIAGFTIKGEGTIKLMIRGFGSGLGLSPCLNTKIELQTFPDGNLIASNDDWQTAANASQIPQALQLPNATDAGLLVDLPAGAYTAIMTPTAGSCNGIGLIGVDVVQ